MLLEYKPDLDACVYHAFTLLTDNEEDETPELESSYYFTITTLLNTAPATNFYGMAVSALWYFLKKFDVSDVNLGNITVRGQPLTREQLFEKRVQSHFL